MLLFTSIEFWAFLAVAAICTINTENCGQMGEYCRCKAKELLITNILPPPAPFRKHHSGGKNPVVKRILAFISVRGLHLRRLLRRGNLSAKAAKYSRMSFLFIFKIYAVAGQSRILLRCHCGCQRTDGGFPSCDK